MNRFVLMFAVSLAACSVLLNPTLINDAVLLIDGLKLLETDAKLLGAPTSDITIATDTVQTALVDLKRGAKTPADFAKVANDEVTQLAPRVLKTFGTNEKITTGIVLIQQLAPLLVTDVTNTAPTAAMGPHYRDPRAELQHWMDRK